MMYDVTRLCLINISTADTSLHRLLNRQVYYTGRRGERTRKCFQHFKFETVERLGDWKPEPCQVNIDIEIPGII